MADDASGDTAWPCAGHEVWLPGEQPVSAERLAAVSELLAIEAALLDAGETDRWLDLLTDDIEYWVPLAWNARAPQGQLNLVYDDRRLLTDRVYRIKTGDAHSQDPPSRVTRAVSNVRCRSAEEPGQDWVVHSVFILHETRHERVSAYSGRYSHVLRETGDGLRIARKRIDLTTSDHVLPNLTFLL